MATGNVGTASSKPQSKGFIGFLKHVGHIFHVGFDTIRPYLALTNLIPGAGPIITAVAGSITVVEQKFAAMGQQTGTGPQKLAEVTAIVGPMVEQMFTVAGQTADAAAVTKYINDIVAILNDSPVPSQLLQISPIPVNISATPAAPTSK